MNYKLGFKLVLLIIFSPSFLFAQSTFFIKYKNYISKQEIANKVQTQQFLPSGKSYSFSNFSPKVNYLAKGIAKQDEILGKIIKVTYNRQVDESSFLSLKNDDPAIEDIEQSKTYSLEFTPNDSLLQNQWGLAKIHAYDAWNITQGSDSVLLAIIDTGIDYLHPDLRNKIKLNQGEIGLDNNGHDKRFNGIDDDNNGFIDDYMGWDFTDRTGFPFDSSGGDYLNWDNDPMDQYGHGTAIAGIAAAETNNITGIAGAAPNIKILNCRAFDPGGFGEEDDVAAAMLYAVQMGARVINMSFGDVSFSFVLRDVIEYAYSKNVVLVGSAGNSNSDAPHYPSGYSQVICVGNSTDQDFRASNSNYGSTLDLMAPGTQIFTTLMNDQYGYVSGTSASTPFVSAAAALILSQNPSFTNEEVIQVLKSTSDDIGDPGWDIYTGAGRLNIYNALKVGAPSIIQFEHPIQDFSTYQDTLQVVATILSPYFVNYQLDYGYGLNPTNWISLIQDGRTQFAGQTIYTLNLSQLPDSVYALRMLVNLNNGRTLEERVNFNIIRTPPQIQLVNIGPAFYGDRATVLASVYSNQPCITKMYYRRLGTTSNFNFITLDAFNTNNEFVGYVHYGFIPKQLVEQNSFYQVYLQAENLVGLKTTILNGSGSDSIFVIPTNFNADYAAEYEQPYSLPVGNIFKNPTNFITNDFNEILARAFYTSSDVYYSLYKLENNTLVKIDSIKNKLPRDVGDFNNDGKVDLLSSDIGTGYIDEQNNSSFSFQNKFTDSSGTFWPALETDVYGEGKPDVIAFDQNTDTSIYIWKFNNDFTLSGKTGVPNYTSQRFSGNLMGIPNSVITDVNHNGRKEIWFIDEDGDIFSYESDGIGGLKKFVQDSTFFISSAEFITAGDFDGDGTEEIAVLLHSLTNFDIAPFYLLNIYKFSSNSLSLIYQQSFIDPSTEFGSGGTFRVIDNSIRFADIDNDGVAELILFVFPYSYIFKFDPLNPSEPKIISYKENINSNSVFVGDLNKNNVPEIAFPTSNGIKFVEFAVSNKASTPYNVIGYSTDSATIHLTWNGSGQVFYIYHGISPDSLELIDSTGNKEYTDINLRANIYYYYGIQGYDISKPDPHSQLSPTIQVYSHTPGKVVSVKSQSRKNLQVTFSQRVNNTIENLQSFEVQGFGYPNSVSAANQYSYLLSFSKTIPVGLNTLITKDLKDYYGSPIATSSFEFNVDSVLATEEFFISSFEILDPYRIKIVFNKEVNEIEAKNANNYSFDPENKVTSVEINPSDKKIIYLNLKGNKPVGSIGKEYRLRILNLSSSDGIEINTGAGSYIILTGYAKDLSDVYVYPNPARVSSGKMTFANLPKRAKIIIWNLEGMRINEINETDGNGGVDFNMKDESGKELGSGIYIYRVVRLDSADNEVEEKIGKFAVIR